MTLLFGLLGLGGMRTFEQINITVSSLLLKRIDEHAKAQGKDT